MFKWLWKQWFMPWFLELWGVVGEQSQDPELSLKLASLAKAMRVPAPGLALVSDYTPHALMVAPLGASPQIVLHRGLLQLLTQDELDAVLCHLLAQQRYLAFRIAPWLVLLSYTLASPFGFLPALSRSLMHLGPLACLRFWLRPRRFLRVDRDVAAYLGQPHALVAALQKSAVLAQKLKPQSMHWSWDFLFWISPDENELSVLRTHPLPQARARALLALA